MIRLSVFVLVRFIFTLTSLKTNQKIKHIDRKLDSSDDCHPASSGTTWGNQTPVNDTNVSVYVSMSWMFIQHFNASDADIWRSVDGFIRSSALGIMLISHITKPFGWSVCKLLQGSIGSRQRQPFPGDLNVPATECVCCVQQTSLLGGNGPSLQSNCSKPDRCENPFSVNYWLQRHCLPKARHQYKSLSFFLMAIFSHYVVEELHWSNVAVIAGLNTHSGPDRLQFSCVH